MYFHSAAGESVLPPSGEIENHFRICLDEEAEAEIVTVGDLARVIRRMRED